VIVAFASTYSVMPAGAWRAQLTTIDGAMRRARRAVAVTCIALVVFAAFLPLGGASLEWLVVTPAFTLLPSSTTQVVTREAPRCDEQLVELLAIFESRGPPSSSSLA